MTFSTDQIEALSAPLDRSKVASRKQGGQEVSYVQAWHVIAEANRIFGFDGWHRETILLQETNRDLVTVKGQNGPYEQWRIGYIAKVKVTVGGVVREGTGYGSGMGKPEAVGDAVEGAVKEAETDAMKRALMTFGNPFGLALYDKTQANVVDAPDVGNAAVDFAVGQLRCCKTADEFKDFWAKNKDGLKEQLTTPEYARVITAMKEEAKRFAPAEQQETA